MVWAAVSTTAGPVRVAVSKSKPQPAEARARTVAPEPAASNIVSGSGIGTLTIPALKQKLPIVEGTGKAELKKGVGHYAGSVMPGVDDNCVLSGHRDTVFTRLSELKIGDKLIVQTPEGQYTYMIRRIRIVDKDDRTVIVPTDHVVLTVTTCYPFRYVGSAPDRYIVSADLIGRE